MSSLRVLLLWVLALCATSTAVIVHLTLRFENVRLGYEIGRLRREQQQLTEQHRMLTVEVAALKEVERIEQYAQEKLSLRAPEARQIIQLTEKSRRSLAGRTR